MWVCLIYFFDGSLQYSTHNALLKNSGPIVSGGSEGNSGRTETVEQCSRIWARHCQSRTSPLLKLVRTTEHATYMYSTITELCQKYGKHIFLVNQSLKCSWLFIFWWKKYRIQQTMAHQRQPFCFFIECLIVILCTVIVPSPAPGQVRWKPVWTGGGVKTIITINTNVIQIHCSHNIPLY